MYLVTHKSEVVGDDMTHIDIIIHGHLSHLLTDEGLVRSTPSSPLHRIPMYKCVYICT
jgi:hypothetical protein